MFFKIILRIFKKFFIVFFSLIAVVATYMYVYGNFHKVDNDIYRSAQLFSFNMPYYVQKYKIKSMLNLRGVDNRFYEDEIKISKENNITHYDFGIGDREVQSLETMKKIVKIIKNAPKPILIHCKAGADRTSLATALYLYTTGRKDMAKSSFSPIYLHFPYLGSKTIAMDKSFEIFVKYTNKQGK